MDEIKDSLKHLKSIPFFCRRCGEWKWLGKGWLCEDCLRKQIVEFEKIAGSIDRAIRAATEVKPQETCVWSFDQWSDDFYETSCGKAFTLIEGTLEENDMRYCTYCGKPIETTQEDS